MNRSHKENKGWKFLRVSGFIFLAFSMLWYKLSYHELWKDEWQAWFDVRDMGLTEMLAFLNYEGHPALYYLYLKLFVAFEGIVSDPVIIQFSHWLIYILTLWLFLFRFKLPMIMKLALALGYFMFFEYGVVNRAYIMVILFSFLLTDLIKRRQYGWTVFFSFFLISQTEVYGVLIGGGLLFYMLIAGLQNSKEILLQVRNFIKPILAYLGGVLVFIYTVFPRGNDAEFSNAYLQDPFSSGVMLDAFQALLANTFFLGLVKDTSTFGYQPFGIALSIGLIPIFYGLFRRHKKLLLTGLVFLIVTYLFSCAIYTGGIRQWGMVFVFFICLLELRGFDVYTKEKYAWTAVLFVSLFQLIHSGRALVKDYHQPFTNAKMAGHFLRDKVPDQVPIVAINKFEATPVIGYAERKFYELPQGTEFSYFKWLEKIYFPSEAEMKLFADYKKVGGLIVVSPKSLPEEMYPNLLLWKQFTGANFKNENYFIYTLEND